MRKRYSSLVTQESSFERKGFERKDENFIPSETLLLDLILSPRPSFEFICIIRETLAFIFNQYFAVLGHHTLVETLIYHYGQLIGH